MSSACFQGGGRGSIWTVRVARDRSDLLQTDGRKSAACAPLPKVEVVSFNSDRREAVDGRNGSRGRDAVCLSVPFFFLKKKVHFTPLKYFIGSFYTLTIENGSPYFLTIFLFLSLYKSYYTMKLIGLSTEHDLNIKVLDFKQIVYVQIQIQNRIHFTTEGEEQDT